ncbi:hypothetical protein GHT06_015653 [Daphnia sinensis]|uniref:Uncharacterized protein n=1 Tax=Daphnia sinensis TaxID=1820382 RepID=A0AAD5KSS5_9CRUS|nr:hypothetical protein GHT06_015653 [Daphnia sinensis]
METSLVPNYNPEIPTNFRADDCLDFVGSRGDFIKFHKKTGYFYYWKVGPKGEILLQCACRQFMVKHHTSKCIYNASEYEMMEACWLSYWFPLGSSDKWHNHRPPSRFSVELSLFKWQVSLTVAKSQNVKLIGDVIDELYPSWPFTLTLSKWQLKKLMYFAEASKLLNQECVDSMMATLMTSPEYWGPPVESTNHNRHFSESQQCCEKVTQRSKFTAIFRSPKKMKKCNDNNSDYDTEPLPENAAETKRYEIDEPIASGSGCCTPQPKRFMPDVHVPSISESRTENVPVKPESTTGWLDGALSLRTTVKDIQIETLEEEVPIQVRFAETLLKQSKMVGNRSGMDLYAVPFDKRSISCSGVERFVFGNPDCAKEHRVVLVLGAIGTSQPKFINAIINYVFYVRDQDNFRFQMIEEQNLDQTNCISVYVIHHSEGYRIPFSLTIVHTPSYSDVTEGELFRHRKLTKLFREFFEDDGIEQLDMVCNLLLKDGANNSLLSIFGYDIEENVHCFSPNDDSFLTAHFFQRFFSMLASMTTKSLELTKEVLHVMKSLEKTMGAFFPLVKSGAAKLDELKNARQIIGICQSRREVNGRVANTFKLVTAEEKYKSEVLWKTIQSGGNELVNLLKADFNGIVQAVLEHYEIASESIQQLKKISRGNPFLTQELYNLLFEVEQKLKHFGHGERLNCKGVQSHPTSDRMSLLGAIMDGKKWIKSISFVLPHVIFCLFRFQSQYITSPAETDDGTMTTFSCPDLDV